MRPVRNASVPDKMTPLELLLDLMDESRERLLVALEPLDDQALLAVQTVGDHSIAHVLSNLTAWESELVTGLMKLDQNKKPGNMLDALANPAAYDQSFFAESQERDLDQVFEDLQLVRIQLEDWLSAFSDRDLTDRRRYRWLNGRALREIIITMTIDRESNFLPSIEAFSQDWLNKQNNLAKSVIPLTLNVNPMEEKDDDLTN